jgi:hypothetical protein
MNVLFDDGRYITRVLVHDDQNPYEPYSEAFQFYKYVDNVWGDFRTRDLEEVNYSFNNLPPNIYDFTTNMTVAPEAALTAAMNTNNIHFKTHYFLKQIPFIRIPAPANKRIAWQSLQEIDIAILLSPAILSEPLAQNAIGVAFSIYMREYFNVIGNAVNNREKVTSYYLAVRLVTDGGVAGILPNGIVTIPANILIQEPCNPREDLIPPENDHNSLYRLAPTLVLNIETILKSRNYPGNPNSDRNPHMYIRIGRDCDKYILFLHGEQEATCPIRIPSE